MSLFSRFPRVTTVAPILFFTFTTAWAAYNIWTSEYTLSKAELQQTLAKQFPRNVTYQGIFNVSVANPQIALDAAQNRITTVVDTRIASQLLLAKDITGKIALTSGINYDAGTRSLRLDQPVVTNVNIDGSTQQGNQDIANIANVAVSQLLNNYAIYTFTPEQLALNGQHFEPGKITVGKDTVTVEVIQK